MKDRGLTIRALRSLVTRIQERESQPFSAQAYVGGPLTHEISQMKEGWERFGQILEKRLGRLTLDQRVESQKRQELAFEVEGAKAAAKRRIVICEKFGNSLAALH